MKQKTVIFAALVGAIMLLTWAQVTVAQEPIRVQSNEVLVPVFVWDKQRVRALVSGPENGNLGRALLAGDAELVDKIIEGPVIRDLTAADFQVFDDGKERAVRSVAYEQSLYWDVRDNVGHHTEYIGPGGGKWSTIEWPPKTIGDLVSTHYLVAFPLPESPDGSCHQVRITVNRPNAFIAARTEYCNTNHSPSDPLNGTRLAEQLESGLAAKKDNTVDISVLAIALYSNGDLARVHISLDWPWESLKGMMRTKGVLGMVLGKDGSLVTRFSDLADRYGVPSSEVIQWWPHHEDRTEIKLVENRYDGQVELPPGEYQLRVALGDGTRLGKAEIPLTVDSYDRKSISISPVSLCKQISDVSANATRKLPGAWNAKPWSYFPLVSNDVEFKPTSNTRFKAAKNLYVYFEIYEPYPEAGAPSTVEFQVRIVDVQTGAVVSDLHPISAAPYWKAGNSIIPVGRGIDISRLPKGTYRLDVRVSDSAGKSAESRPVNFTIE